MKLIVDKVWFFLLVIKEIRCGQKPSLHFLYVSQVTLKLWNRAYYPQQSCIFVIYISPFKCTWSFKLQNLIGSNNKLVTWLMWILQTGLCFFTNVNNTLTLSSIFNVSLKIRVPLGVKISIYSGIQRAVFKIHTG